MMVAVSVQDGIAGFEWILLVAGGVLMLVVLGFFVFTLTRKEPPGGDGG
ncbi:MAG: hypothetical protein IH983_13360 [Planctomycetes bacterium]|nr:hypothetical protein [Planctomycetota bacterium]